MMSTLESTPDRSWAGRCEIYILGINTSKKPRVVFEVTNSVSKIKRRFIGYIGVWDYDDMGKNIENAWAHIEPSAVAFLDEVGGGVIGCAYNPLTKVLHTRQ